MDWNKTKTIFIIVFSILNIFLYSLYINRLTDAQNVQVMEKTPVEDLLKMDNISYGNLPPYINDPSYLSAKFLTFTADEVAGLEGQQAVIVDETHLKSKLKESVSVMTTKGDFDFTDFLSKYVLNGSEYTLWEVDEEERSALFFQRGEKQSDLLQP